VALTPQGSEERERSMAQSYEDLVVWQRSMQLTTVVYRLTQDFPREELYGLTSQIRRAAVSVPSNIAEGQGRNNAGEFRQFLGIARVSNCEVQTLLQIAQSLGLGKRELISEAQSLSIEIRRMLYGLLDSLA
jgi:four helix bundle protein